METTPVQVSHTAARDFGVHTGNLLFYFVIYLLESQTCIEWSFCRNHLWGERRDSQKGRQKKNKLPQCPTEVGMTSRNFRDGYLGEVSGPEGSCPMNPIRINTQTGKCSSKYFILLQNCFPCSVVPEFFVCWVNVIWEHMFQLTCPCILHISN